MARLYKGGANAVVDHQLKREIAFASGDIQDASALPQSLLPKYFHHPFTKTDDDGRRRRRRSVNIYMFNLHLFFFGGGTCSLCKILLLLILLVSYIWARADRGSLSSKGSLGSCSRVLISAFFLLYPSIRCVSVSSTKKCLYLHLSPFHSIHSLFFSTHASTTWNDNPCLLPSHISLSTRTCKVGPLSLHVQSLQKRKKGRKEGR